MSYEQTNSDGLYIEDSYFTPDGYFVYVAEAASAMAVQASVSADISVGRLQSASADLTCSVSQNTVGSAVRGGASSMSASTAVSATISHIEGADLFAFTDAQLAAEVSVIRDYNIHLILKIYYLVILIHINCLLF